MDCINQIWPKWTTVSVLGEGGFGKVYKVKREEFGYVSYAAVKVIQIPKDESEAKELQNSGMDYASIQNYYEDVVKKLINEIKIMATLKTSDHIVSIEDYDIVKNELKIGWTVYIRMELLESLNNYQQRKSNLTVPECVDIGIDICSALIDCESLGIIHRDIKPDNIFRNEYGSYKLGDFGISKQLENTKAAKSVLGTMYYVAPEVVKSQSYDHTVDIYSLGLTLYKLLNQGRMPFMPPAPEPMLPSDMESAMVRRISGEKIPPIPGLDQEIMKILQRACSPDSKGRYQAAADMKDALLQWKNGTSSNRQKNAKKEAKKSAARKQSAGQKHQPLQGEKKSFTDTAIGEFLFYVCILFFFGGILLCFVVPHPISFIWTIFFGFIIFRTAKKKRQKVK